MEIKARIYKDLVAIPPGQTIDDERIGRGISKEELAKILDMNILKLECFLNGEVRLNYNIALKLENLLGINSTFWILLEENYRIDLEKIIGAKNLDRVNK